MKSDFRQEDVRYRQESWLKFFINISRHLWKKHYIIKNMDRNAVKQAAELSVDQEYIREQLKKEGLVAFVADGSILRENRAVSQRPMKDAVPFASPDSMRITMIASI